MIELSIIIVNYNVKAFLQNCLISILKAVENIPNEIIVVDNASDDGSIELIEKNFPEVILIKSDRNLGFSSANNLALRQSRGKYICLINPDTIVQENTFLELISFAKNNEKIGLAGCKIINPDGSFQLACRRSFPTPWVAFTKVIGLSKLFPKLKIFSKYNLTYLDENKTYEVDAISGSFMFLRRDVYEKIGGLDEDFFMYGEDLDWCYRVKESGYKVYYVHSTQIIHFKGESTRRSNLDEVKIFYDAMRLFVKKHFSSSWLLGIFLQFAINLRSIVAFLGQRTLIITAILIDVVLFNLAILISEILYMALSRFGGFPDYAYPIIFVVPVLIFLIISISVGSYEIKNLSVSKILVSIFLSFLFTSSLTYFFKSYAFSRAIILIQYFILFIILPLWRILVKIIFRYPKSTRKSLFEANTLIVGTNESAIELLRRLKQSYSYYYDIVGLIDTNRKRISEKIQDVEIIGSIESIDRIIREKKINEVIFAADFLSYKELLKIVASNQNLSTQFHLVDKNYDFIVGKKDVYELEQLPLIEIDYNITDPSHRYLKRLLDLILGLPLLFFVYPFIYLFSLISKKKNKLLYLPLVITGKYSLVGFPPNGTEIKMILGKPGITGIVQINDSKNLSDGEKEHLNIYYARNQNIWLDIEILIKSFQNFFRK